MKIHLGWTLIGFIHRRNNIFEHGFKYFSHSQNPRPLFIWYRTSSSIVFSFTSSYFIRITIFTTNIITLITIIVTLLCILIKKLYHVYGSYVCLKKLWQCIPCSSSVLLCWLVVHTFEFCCFAMSALEKAGNRLVGWILRHELLLEMMFKNWADLLL